MSAETTVDDARDDLACCEEWCPLEDRGDGEHAETCPMSTITLTKRDLVLMAEGIAGEAAESFRLGIKVCDLSEDEALDTAIDEVSESTICYVGIGSCGRGWCNH